MVNAAEVKDVFASSRMDMTRFTLIMVFLIEQRWRYYIEKELEPDGITTKQWLMLIVIGAGFRHAPSIQEVADAMSTTHQNVKQIAASMERRGFMTLERDPENKRIIRLKVTERCNDLFRRRNEHDEQAVQRMFENLTDEEMKALFDIVAKMDYRASQLYEEAKNTRLGQAQKGAESVDRENG